MECATGWQVFFFQAEDGIRDLTVTGVQTCALPIWMGPWSRLSVTTWTVQPVSATPACRAMATASIVPANSGSSDGWMLMIRPSNWRVKGERERGGEGERGGLGGGRVN